MWKIKPIYPESITCAQCESRLRCLGKSWPYCKPNPNIEAPLYETREPDFDVHWFNWMIGFFFFISFFVIFIIYFGGV